MKTTKRRPRKRGRPMGRPRKLPDVTLVARLLRKFDELQPASQRSFIMQAIDRCQDHSLGLSVTVQQAESEDGKDGEPIAVGEADL